MQNMTTKPELVGFLELQVGSISVNVPIKSRGPAAAGAPLAELETEGRSVAILVTGDAGSKAVEKAVAETAHEAMKYLSRKLLN